MKNFTIRLYTIDTVIEYKVEARHMITAESIALDRYSKDGGRDAIIRVESSGEI